jgi:hypothetical protein
MQFFHEVFLAGLVVSVAALLPALFLRRPRST